MSALTLTLSDDAGEFVEAEAIAAGFASPETYVQELVRAEQKRKAREKLEALIIEGLESGEPTPMTAEDWASLHKGLERQIALDGGA